MGKVYIWTPTTPTGFLNDELDALWNALSPFEDAVYFGPGALPQGAALVAWDTNKGAGLNMPAGSVTTARGSIWLPPTLRGKTLEATLVWAPTGGASNDIYTRLMMSSVADGATPTLKVMGWEAATMSGAANRVVFQTFADTEPSLAGSEFLGLQVQRDGTHASDTYTGAVLLLGGKLSLT